MAQSTFKVCAVLCLLLAGISSCNTANEPPSRIIAAQTENDYIGPHHEQHKSTMAHPFATEAQWDSFNNYKVNDITHIRLPRSDRFKTFGWHLYSKGSAYQEYNFSALWGISYFSYLVDATTGSYTNIHEWKTTAMVDSAKAHGCKVFLSVSNFGAHDNQLFLENKKAQRVLVDSLLALLQLRGADGVNIDFEGIPAGSRHRFSEFVTMLSQGLKSNNPDLLVTVALYTVDYHKVFDIPAIDTFVDLYTLMAYDYYGGFSHMAGPVSPLLSSDTWGQQSIEASVGYYLNAGVASDKLIVGLPYYGAEWQTESLNIPSRSSKFISHPPYSIVKRKYLDSLKVPVYFDKNSNSSYVVFIDRDSSYKQIWFSDSVSLAIKYDWVKANGLGGIGIWALGYDSGNMELWELLNAKFGKSTVRQD